MILPIVFVSGRPTTPKIMEKSPERSRVTIPPHAPVKTCLNSSPKEIVRGINFFLTLQKKKSIK